jgi:hypothetical protein
MFKINNWQYGINRAVRLSCITGHIQSKGFFFGFTTFWQYQEKLLIVLLFEVWGEAQVP